MTAAKKTPAKKAPAKKAPAKKAPAKKAPAKKAPRAINAISKTKPVGNSTKPEKLAKASPKKRLSKSIQIVVALSVVTLTLIGTFVVPKIQSSRAELNLEDIATEEVCNSVRELINRSTLAAGSFQQMRSNVINQATDIATFSPKRDGGWKGYVGTDVRQIGITDDLPLHYRNFKNDNNKDVARSLRRLQDQAWVYAIWRSSSDTISTNLLTGEYRDAISDFKDACWETGN